MKGDIVRRSQQRWPESWIRCTAVSCLLMAIIGLRSPSILADSVRTAQIRDIGSLDATNTATPIAYVSDHDGLFQSTSPSFATWQQVNAVPGISAVSANPHNAHDLIYATDAGLFHSLDAGRTATRRLPCPIVQLARAPQEPALVYALANSHANAGVPSQSTEFADPPCFQTVEQSSLWQSADDGQTWQLVYVHPAGPTNALIDDSFAFDPFLRNHMWMVTVIYTDTGSTYGVLESHDGGRHWQSTHQFDPAPGQGPSHLQIDPVHPGTFWSTHENGPDWAPISQVFRNQAAVAQQHLDAGQIVQMACDPRSGRLYVMIEVVTNEQHYNQIFALSPDGAYAQPVGGPFEHEGRQPVMVVTQNGYLLAGNDHALLQVFPVLGANAWKRLDFFSVPTFPHHATYGAELLGDPISPIDECAKGYCQYFVKGGIVSVRPTPPRQAELLPLVSRLLAARAPLPVGGSTSSVTYAVMRTAHTRMVSPPATLREGTMSVAGGVFVPYSAHLVRAPGYIVPWYFWQYMTDARKNPEGWLQDFGLPLTNVLSATVTKGTHAQRAIMVQAFQDAVLTFDPQTSLAYRVERANIGINYATVFPGEVR